MQKEKVRGGRGNRSTLHGAQIKQIYRNALFIRRGENARKEILYSTPRLVAQFVDHQFSSEDGLYNFEIGLSGAGLFTWQVVFCTDDESFIEPRRLLASQLCFVARTNPIKGEVWSNEMFVAIEGDFRLYALAITPSGDCYSIAGTLCEALTNFYEAHLNEKTGSKFPKELTHALNRLSDNNGARLFTKTSALEPFFDKAKKSTPTKIVKGGRSSSKRNGQPPTKRTRKSLSLDGDGRDRTEGPST